jgi:phospholipid/cholesterol/gamma-HCH transport system substrate-binding protein
METKANYVLIGAATIVGTLLILIFATWITTGDLRRGSYEYDVVFDDPVRGLSEGGEVRFNGIKIGEVESLRIDPDNNNRVIARIRVQSDVPVKNDTEGQLEPVGLTGVTLIQLSTGSADAELLRPAFGAPPPRIQGRGSQIDVIVARGEEVAMRASEAMAAVRDLLTDENIARVTRTLQNLETVSQQLASRDSVITQSGEAAQEIAALARQMQGDLADLDQVLDSVNQAAGVASGETLPELALAAEEIRRAASSISRVANNLEENPSVLTPRSPRPTVELEP